MRCVMNKMCSYKYLVKMVESNDTEMVQNIISNYKIENHNFFTEQNIFNYIVKNIQEWYPQSIIRKKEDIVHPKYIYFMDLFVSLLKNENFIINAENIRISISSLNQFFPHHNLIIEKIKKQNFVSNLSLKEKTNLLLIISEYGLKRDDHTYYKLNYKKYVTIFTKDEIKDCQSYFIKNYETFFENYYSPVSENKNIAIKTKRIVKKILIKQDISNIFNKIKEPKQNNIVLGQNVKYVNMLEPLYHFVARQNKVKYGYSCLYKNPLKFFLFFSEYVRPHAYSHNYQDIINWILSIQKTYNISSVSWDNRYFYDKSIVDIKKIVNKSIQESLLFLKMTDLKDIHLQFKSPHTDSYGGFYQNMFSSAIKKNAHVIHLNSCEFKDGLKTVLIHELTHFLHFQTKNSQCFTSEHFKKIKDKIYFHKERKKIINAINKIRNQEVKHNLLNYFEDYGHQSYSKIKVYFKDLMTNYSRYEKEISNIELVIKDYKTYKYTDSKQYLTWQNYAMASGLEPTYFNRNYEIHARLNEILASDDSHEFIFMGYFEKNGELFQSIKNDLIKFNRFLMK